MLATVPSEPVFFGFGTPLSVLPDDLLEPFLFESFLAVELSELLPFEEFCVLFLSCEPVLLPFDDFEFEAVVVEEEPLEESLSLFGGNLRAVATVFARRAGRTAGFLCPSCHPRRWRNFAYRFCPASRCCRPWTIANSRRSIARVFARGVLEPLRGPPNF